ncbi:hypothetical protein D9613_010164 [Agrocybe pediades]|uniref:MATE efflux family protein n=1 Tax=Agrocybe pediades TaxID=84607 RepID=A0A8H4QWZ5_9AGAR|nr:hypothetical protein D9613_010164 [Agrocybe pediades]KAF9568307.1 multidrug/Oligosaccharidyl-lipid/Polysaccharide flippase [Agrocybe pediades]
MATEETPLLHQPADAECIESDSRPKAAILREELWTLVRFALPIFGTQTLEYTLVSASVISIGHLSTTALAGITLGSMTSNVTGYSIIQGLASALDTMLPSAWTSPQPHLVGLWSQRMMLVIFASLIPMYIAWFNAETILLSLKQDPEVAHLAAVYLRWISLGLPAYAFNSISRRYFQSQGLFAAPTRIVLAVAPINLLLNWLLVWGPEPVRLGYIGAPIATAISFNLISIMSIMYGILYAPRTAWCPPSRRMFSNLGILVRLGLSGVGQTTCEWWAWELIGLAASLLGPAALAAQSILIISGTTTYQAPYALSVATAVRIGNLLGEGNAKRAGVTSTTAMLLALTIGLLNSTMFVVFRKNWAYIFNDDPEVVGLVASVMPIVALFQVFDGMAGITGGIMRARGLQFLGAIFNFSAYYMLGIPLALFFTFKLHMDLYGLWLGLTFSLVYCAAAGTYVSLRTNWDSEVEKAAERVRAEERERLEEIRVATATEEAEAESV